MCSWPTRSQRVEAIGGGTGRPEEPSEEFRPTDPRSLHSRHPERGSMLLIGLHSLGRSRGRYSFSGMYRARGCGVGEACV